MEDSKIRIVVFWLFIAGTMLANTLLYLLVPGVIEEIQSGVIVGMQAGHELILGMAIAYYWIPLFMAVLALVLNAKFSRWINIGVGSFYVVFVLFELVMNATTVAYPYAILMDISVVAVATLIVWNAWNWKPRLREKVVASEVSA